MPDLDKLLKLPCASGQAPPPLAAAGAFAAPGVVICRAWRVVDEALRKFGEG